MYASKIKIDYSKQRVKYHREVELKDGLLTIDEISKHIKEGEEFGFRKIEEGFYLDKTIMDIFGYRLETEEEMNLRISKQEKYNENYEKHHIKYKK